MVLCELTEFIDKTTLEYNGGDNLVNDIPNKSNTKEGKNERKKDSHKRAHAYAYAQKSDCRNNAYSNITIQYSFIILKCICVRILNARCAGTVWCACVFTQFHADGEWK